MFFDNFEKLFDNFQNLNRNSNKLVKNTKQNYHDQIKLVKFFRNPLMSHDKKLNSFKLSLCWIINSKVSSNWLTQFTPTLSTPGTLHTKKAVPPNCTVRFWDVIWNRWKSVAFRYKTWAFLTSASSGKVLSLLSILLSILFINCPVSIHSFFQSVFASIDLWSVMRQERKNCLSFQL